MLLSERFIKNGNPHYYTFRKAATVRLEKRDIMFELRRAIVNICKMFWNSVNIAAFMRKMNRQGGRYLSNLLTEIGMHKSRDLAEQWMIHCAAWKYLVDTAEHGS